MITYSTLADLFLSLFGVIKLLLMILTYFANKANGNYFYQSLAKRIFNLNIKEKFTDIFSFHNINGKIDNFYINEMKKYLNIKKIIKCQME